LNATPGNLVSYWEIRPLISEPKLTYEYAAACGDVFGSGFGDRRICDVIGLNVYRGAPCSCRPHPSPLVDDKDIPYHQYYSTKNWKPLLQASVEKHLNTLTFQANNFFSSSYKPLASISDHKGERRILTCGQRPCVEEKKKLPSFIGQYPVFGFANGKHLDSGDVYPKSMQQIMEGENSGCINRLKKFEGFCGPTTCGYQFLYKDDGLKQTMKPCQYFCLNGLGLAMEIQDGIGHTFLASSFSHQTSLCVARIQQGEQDSIRMLNMDDNFLLFAWGNSSGGVGDAMAGNGPDSSIVSLLSCHFFCTSDNGSPSSSLATTTSASVATTTGCGVLATGAATSSTGSSSSSSL
jgi:hypothetical protein